MKLLIFLLVVPFVFSSPVLTGRHYIPEEENPDFKRYIYVENAEGQIELIDLRDTGNKTSPKVTLASVQYDLYTPNNPHGGHTITHNNVGNLAHTNFDPKRLNIFVCHGWNGNRNSDANTVIRQALFGVHDVNLFIVDWSGPANEFYLGAKDSVVAVGNILGAFINQMQSAYSLNGDQFILIGHSLGAHVVGCAGAVANSKVGNIIGMDPAGPLYSLNNIHDRLDITDGKHVQITHSNGGLLGIGSSVGHADFFPNGGMWQPGCGWDLAGTCAHSKCYLYVAEAIQRGALVFRSVMCNSWDIFQKGQCSGNTQAFMADLAPKGHVGDFFLSTRENAPFGLS